MEYAKTHEDWNKVLEIIAGKWGVEYNIDSEEAYSELLVAYAEALACPKRNEAVKFDTIFYFYKKKALRNLLGKRDNDRKYMSFVMDEDLDLYSHDDAIKAISEIIFDIDCAKLDEDTLAVLEFIKSKEFADKKFRTLGERTIVNELTEKGWGYRRAERAVKRLGEFYKGYMVA